MELLERIYKMIEGRIEAEEAHRDTVEVDEQPIYDGKLECLHWVLEQIEELQDIEMVDELF